MSIPDVNRGVRPRRFRECTMHDDLELRITVSSLRSEDQ